jgi:deaminated glutathione amidase
METHFKVALAQYLNDSDPPIIVEEAKIAGAEVAVFPEMYSNGYTRFDPEGSAVMEHGRTGAQSPHGKFIERFRGQQGHLK